MKNKIEKNMHWFFIAPALLIISVFSILPIFVAIGVSFTNMNLRGLLNPALVQFVGFDNYVALFNNANFLQALSNTVFYVVIGVPLVVLLSMTVALLLDYGSGRLFVAYRALFYMPSVTTSVAIAVVFGFLYNTQHGLFNYLLSLVGHEGINWLNDAFTARISLIIMAVWRGLGINMIIFLVALQSIPRDYYEAAELDGATKLQKLLHIKIPLLGFATFFVSITTLIGWFQFFEEPFIMTSGGPMGGTNSIALFIYNTGFGVNQFGFAAAGSVILFLIILTATLINFSMRKKSNSLI